MIGLGQLSLGYLVFRQTRPMTTAAIGVPPSIKKFWPLLLMGVFMVGNWIPYFLSRAEAQTSTENIEANVNNWSEDLGLSVQKQHPSPDLNFLYVVTLNNKTPVLVSRAKEKPQFLQLQITLTLAPEHEAALEKLSTEQIQHVADQVVLEAARTHVGYAMVKGPPRGIILDKGVPITSGLNEATFASYLDEMDSANVACRQTIILALAREQKELAQNKKTK